MVATRMAPIAALTLALPMVMLLAACAPTSCTEPSSVKVVVDDQNAVSISCLDGCADDVAIEQLGSAADRTWRVTFDGTPPERFTVAAQDDTGRAVARAELTPDWKTDDGTCAAWSDDLRVAAAG